jgi:hypothetical protein
MSRHICPGSKSFLCRRNRARRTSISKHYRRRSSRMNGRAQSTPLSFLAQWLQSTVRQISRSGIPPTKGAGGVSSRGTQEEPARGPGGLVPSVWRHTKASRIWTSGSPNCKRRPTKTVQLSSPPTNAISNHRRLKCKSFRSNAIRAQLLRRRSTLLWRTAEERGVLLEWGGFRCRCH